MKIKYILLTAFVIALVATFFSWDSLHTVKVSAETLSYEYTKNSEEANKKYLEKKIEVSGKLKAYYRILGAMPVLELETGKGETPIFFFFQTQEEETYAGQIESGTMVSITGKCVGEHEYSFVNGIKIQVEKIEAE